MNGGDVQLDHLRITDTTRALDVAANDAPRITNFTAARTNTAGIVVRGGPMNSGDRTWGGGDTNGDGNDSHAVGGNWGTIAFAAGATFSGTNFEFRYASREPVLP
jgi:hypothetical protein